MKQAKDNFSTQAKLYSKYRPHYPAAIYDFLLPLVPAQQVAWDCGTGNGQVAKVLASHFKEVWATDLSPAQIANAVEVDNVQYRVCRAEASGFEANSVDLITVAQAIHWFDFDGFYREVQRVAKPSALVAIWGYRLLQANHPEIDTLIEQFYTKTIGPYWDAERRYIDERYATIPFPFQELDAPSISMQFQWTLDDLEGYFNTWSSVQRYIRKQETNPVNDLIQAIAPHWGATDQIRTLDFPFFMRVGRIGSIE